MTNYPKKIRVSYFKQDADTRDSFNELYATEEIINNRLEESKFYESLNHEANIKITEL